MGYSPQGHKESDTTESLHFTSLHILRCAIATPEMNSSVKFNIIDLYGIISPIVLICLLKLFFPHPGSSQNLYIHQVMSFLSLFISFFFFVFPLLI